MPSDAADNAFIGLPDSPEAYEEATGYRLTEEQLFESAKLYFLVQGLCSGMKTSPKQLTLMKATIRKALEEFAGAFPRERVAVDDDGTPMYLLSHLVRGALKAARRWEETGDDLSAFRLGAILVHALAHGHGQRIIRDHVLAVGRNEGTQSTKTKAETRKAEMAKLYDETSEHLSHTERCRLVSDRYLKNREAGTKYTVSSVRRILADKKSAHC